MILQEHVSDEKYVGITRVHDDGERDECVDVTV